MQDLSCTCICLAINTHLIGVVSVMDPIKPEARGVIQRLHQMGLDVHMVSGDGWGTARAIAEQLAVKNVTAQVLPSDKMDLVKSLQERKKVVMMVGDGINDSPSIKQADVGVSIASGTDIAVEAADYILMRNDLEDIIVAIDLSKKVFGRIKLNFVWAMGYNLLCVPLAAGVFYPHFRLYIPPGFAGIAMALSSISVVCSSLLLNLYKKPPRVLRDVEIKVVNKMQNS